MATPHKQPQTLRQALIWCTAYRAQANDIRRRQAVYQEVLLDNLANLDYRTLNVARLMILEAELISAEDHADRWSAAAESMLSASVEEPAGY